MRWFSRSGSIAIALAPCLAACGSVHARAKHAPPKDAPPKDSFTSGKVKIELRPGSGLRVRPLTITLTGALAGELEGKITPQRGLPDVGRTFSITARGVVTPLSHVSAAGTVTGVGNARFGKETLGLTLRSRSRSVTLTATSAQVPAFTSP